MRADFPVVLDACVLIPMPLADTCCGWPVITGFTFRNGGSDQGTRFVAGDSFTLDGGKGPSLLMGFERGNEGV